MKKIKFKKFVKSMDRYDMFESKCIFHVTSSIGIIDTNDLRQLKKRYLKLRVDSFSVHCENNRVHMYIYLV